MLRPRRARFWVWLNDGWVKLTLRHPCQSLSWRKSYKTDEGFSYEAGTWTHDGDQVTHEWANGGRDCDGRVDYSGALFCCLADLDAEPAYQDGTTSPYYNGRHIHRPCWNDDGDTRVRDEFAEAAGY